MTSAPAVEVALRALFPASVAVAVERIGRAEPASLWPEEKSAVAGAVPRRLAEFAAGRTAARRVLAALGHPPAALPMGADRAALWPPGLCGSIAHDADLAVAVGRHGAPLGVDLEPDAPLEPELWPVFCSPDELRRLEGDTARLVRQVFCAKEAVFKAQPPDARAMFGFDALAVTLAEGAFNAQFRASIGPFRAGQLLTGRLALVDGVILAGVAW
ncbi:4'-phosphopantetheinyl transferase [Tabrizicola sp.]|uniref:4'-phosphopantetheinyl transferase family protein n=1 Tax=Tabrizicola sp. TaxID=2005166 RepID=UPI00273598EF|nr:4'-phosphopantetheinyl transferase superfamily protein [Tabrizicola sp.]MDP3194721.1 4'-phosphopantetheinyl transferase superfamily protein [Tabrizicola sp.]